MALELGDKVIILGEVSCVLVRILGVADRELDEVCQQDLYSSFHGQSTLLLPRG